MREPELKYPLLDRRFDDLTKTGFDALSFVVRWQEGEVDGQVSEDSVGTPEAVRSHPMA